MNLKRRLREFAARKKRTVTDLLEEEELEKKTELQESLSSSSSKHLTMREPSVNEAREKFFRDCREAATENEWIDLGFLFRRTDRLLSGFMLRHFRVCKSSLVMEYRNPDNRRHYNIENQCPRGYYYLKDARVTGIDSSNGNFQIVMRCGTERSLDVSRHVGLTLRAPTKDCFDRLLRTLCSLSSIQFCVSMNMKGAKHTLLSAPVKIVTAEDQEEADEEEKKEEEEKEEEKEDLDSSEERRDSVLPSAILSRFLEESVKYVNNKEVKTKRSANRFVPTFDRISGLKITEYMSNRLEHVSSNAQDTTNVKPRKRSESSPKRFLQGFRRLLSTKSFKKQNNNASFSSSSSSSSIESRLRGLSSASSTGSNISNVFDIGPMRLQSECNKLPDEIVVMNLRVDDGNVIITPPHDSENYVLVFPCKTVRLEMSDVWNLVIRLNVTKSISIKKDIEIEIRGWRDLPQQMTQLIAMMIQSGTRTCKRSSTFMEEMALIECHPSYVVFERASSKIAPQLKR